MSTTTTAVIQGRKSVISECYDEVIFQDPTQYMYTLLTTTRKLTLSAYKHETNVEERRDRSLAKIKVNFKFAKSDFSILSPLRFIRLLTSDHNSITYFQFSIFNRTDEPRFKPKYRILRISLKLPRKPLLSLRPKYQKFRGMDYRQLTKMPRTTITLRI